MLPKSRRGNRVYRKTEKRVNHMIHQIDLKHHRGTDDKRHECAVVGDVSMTADGCMVYSY